MGRYSNPDNVARLNRILSGQGRDRPSHRPVPSLPQKQTRLADSDRIEVLERYQAGETANALADAFDVNRATIFAILQRAGLKSRYRILTDRDVASATAMYEAGQSLARIATLRRGRSDSAERVPPGWRCDAGSRNEPMEPASRIANARMTSAIRFGWGSAFRWPAPAIDDPDHRTRSRRKTTRARTRRFGDVVVVSRSSAAP